MAFDINFILSLQQRTNENFNLCRNSLSILNEYKKRCEFLVYKKPHFETCTIDSWKNESQYLCFFWCVTVLTEGYENMDANLIVEYKP